MLEALRAERAVVFDEMDRMRVRTISDIDSLMIRAKEESVELLHASIDHVFVKVVQLLLIAGAITGIIVFMVLKKR